jgi:hypothetical protein
VPSADKEGGLITGSSHGTGLLSNGFLGMRLGCMFVTTFRKMWDGVLMCHRAGKR